MTLILILLFFFIIILGTGSSPAQISQRSISPNNSTSTSQFSLHHNSSGSLGSSTPTSLHPQVITQIIIMNKFFKQNLTIFKHINYLINVKNKI